MVGRLKQKMRRVLSLVLTVALLTGAMPLSGIYSSAVGDTNATQPRYYYNMHKLNEWRGIGEPNKPGWQWGSERKKAKPIEEITSFDMTTAGNDVEIFPDSTAETDPWYFIEKDSAAATITYADYMYGVYIGNANTWLTLGIRVGEDGTYNVYSENWEWTQGAIVDVYIAPIDDATNVRDEKYHVGQIDTYGSVNTFGVLYEVGQVSLTKGDYAVCYALTGKNAAVGSKAGVCGFSALILDTVKDRAADAPVITSSGGEQLYRKHNDQHNGAGRVYKDLLYHRRYGTERYQCWIYTAGHNKRIYRRI